MEIPVNMSFVSLTLVALAWIVVIATRAGAQVATTQDALAIAANFQYLGKNAQLDAENATPPLYITSPANVLPLMIGLPVLIGAFNPGQVFSLWAKAISLEATFAHFGSHLDNGDALVQARNLSGRFALLPFGVTRFNFLAGVLDGALEVGLEPTFERFNTQHQNFAGLGLHLRYHLRWCRSSGGKAIGATYQRVLQLNVYRLIAS